MNLILCVFLLYGSRRAPVGLDRIAAPAPKPCRTDGRQIDTPTKFFFKTKWLEACRPEASRELTWRTNFFSHFAGAVSNLGFAERP
jgi:hypothetical protein